MLANSSYEVSDESPFSRLNDLNLESADEGAALKCHVSDAEECCLVGENGSDSYRATSRMLSILERDENFHGDDSGIMISHKITVVQPFEVGLEISGPHNTQDDFGLAPLGVGWSTSKGSTAGRVLTKSILDNPEDHLGTIYEAAGRHLKV